MTTFTITSEAYCDSYYLCYLNILTVSPYKQVQVVRLLRNKLTEDELFKTTVCSENNYSKCLNAVVLGKK